MTIELIILIVLILAVIFFFKNFYSFVYFVAMADIFLRIITYLKSYILKDDVFNFLDFLPSSIPSIIKGIQSDVIVQIGMIIYIIIFIVFEAFIIKKFIKNKF